MDEIELQIIQDQIGYKFQNPDLLQQAFVRRSYSKENGGENNEVLEFIGDKVLDFVVVKLLSEKYGYYLSDCDDYDPEEDCDEFACEYRENKLTELKKRMVCKETLAEQIEHLGFADYLILGKGDRKNHVQQQDSVKEDLFEAILGAVALDSNWNLKKMQSVVEIMLNPEQYLEADEDNYVQLIQDWSERNGNGIPCFHYEEGSYQATWYFPFQGISQNFSALNAIEYQNLNHRCLMKISDDLPVFRGFGKSNSDARKAVCKLAYQYLDEHNLLFTIRDEIENPNEDQAVNQLEILARRNYFSLPTYDFEQKYDEDGNPIWYCECHIEEYEDYYWAEASSKKGAKKSAAFGMLQAVLE